MKEEGWTQRSKTGSGTGQILTRRRRGEETGERGLGGALSSATGAFSFSATGSRLSADRARALWWTMSVPRMAPTTSFLNSFCSSFSKPDKRAQPGSCRMRNATEQWWFCGEGGKRKPRRRGVRDGDGTVESERQPT